MKIQNKSGGQVRPGWGVRGGEDWVVAMLGLGGDVGYGGVNQE